ncbi:hypothetical protein DENSPDRAFT_885090 [Dentipellis sp. KUC8613]|nr:hypothetical protein DENSPDRAFT_885090 [Dentipellis sp. KUC8613]
MQAFPPDALQDPNYLYDPFDTLFFSLDDSAHEYLSPHDIMEAYNTIYLRLRASADQLASSAAHCPPALQFFKNDHEAVSAVLTRDISRALSLPLGLSRNFGTSTDPSRSEPEESSVAARYAKDSSTICHFALRALAQLFQSIAICDILPDDDILKLLDIVITILKTPILPSFNGSKTWRCFIWTFGYLKGRLDEDMMAGARSDLEGKVEGALGVVKQELGHGLGIALLRTLLGSSPPDFGSDFGQHSGSWSILKAISIVEDMLQHQDRDLQSAGIEAFTRLFIRFDLEPLDVEAGNPGKSLLLALLDGTMLSLDENQLSEVLRSTSDDGLKDVRQLSPVEVATCWDTLAACWAMAVHCQRESNTSTMIDVGTLRTLLNVGMILKSPT